MSYIYTTLWYSDVAGEVPGRKRLFAGCVITPVTGTNSLHLHRLGFNYFQISATESLTFTTQHSPYILVSTLFG